jgi:hypothetical protein
MTIRQPVTVATPRPRQPRRPAFRTARLPVTVNSRLTVLETLMQLQAQRLISMQAQLDHLASRNRS